MGYIMPVDRYQYMNYQERFSEERLSVSPVDPTFHVLLDKTQQELSNKYDRQLPSTFQRIPINSGNQHAMEHIYAEITGSGRHFSETI